MLVVGMLVTSLVAFAVNSLWRELSSFYVIAFVFALA
jgi:hypothetical protein